MTLQEESPKQSFPKVSSEAAIRSVPFGEKLRYFAGQNGPE